METELTKKMKRGLVGFKPEMPTNMRTIRFAKEVWTPTGIVDFIFLKQEHPIEIFDLGGDELLSFQV